MNTVDCYVTEVLSAPYEAYGKWWVRVEAESWGRLQETTLMFNTEEEAKQVAIDYHFLG